jgi:peptide/nickel transport system ATP-binding protein
MQSIRGNDISMIFQEASTSLNPVFTIGEQVGESFLFHRLSQILKETIAELDEEIRRSRFFLVQGWKLLQRSLFRAELKHLEVHQDKVQIIDNRLAELEEKTDHRSITEKVLLQRRRERQTKKTFWIEILKRIPFLRRYSRRLKKTIRRHVVELLRQLGVPNPESMPNRYPHELSGGMQQRIVIAIALACHPVLLIADEPTSNLDVTIQAQIMELIKTLKKTTITSVLFITHDLGLVAEICDRATVMYAGDVCETAAVETIFRQPLHPYTQGLLHSVPKVEQVEQLSTIPGIVPNLIDPPSGCRFHPRCPHAMDICSEEKPSTIEHSPGHQVACYLYLDKQR